MSTKHQKRTLLVVTLVLGLGCAAGLILYALQQNINLFYSPTQIAQGLAPQQKMIRVGGMVVDGSVKRGQNLNVDFTLTDYEHELTVHYEGILPDLFREGQGIVAQGVMMDSVFQAREVLAKHDENYMPPEVRDSLKERSS